MTLHSDDTFDGDSLPSCDEIERLLVGRGTPAPDTAFRDGVLAAMEGAAEDRRRMLAAHDRVAGELRPRRRLIPEVVAAIAAAIVVAFLPWGVVGRAVVVPQAPEKMIVAESAPPADEPADVHHALALLDARRDLFAAAAAGNRRIEF